MDPARHKVVVAGSRFGKTYLAIAYLIVAAARFPRSRNWYVCPTRTMAKDIAWTDLKFQLGIDLGLENQPLVWEVNESDLRITLTNGAIIQLMTAVEPDRLRGRVIKTVVFDEYANMDPKIWTAIRPRIGDKRLRLEYGELGRSLFIGCVRGDSMVLSRRGMEPIVGYSSGSADKVLDSLDAEFYGLNQRFHRANGFWNNGFVPTRKVGSHYGFAVECSLPHPWWVMSPQGIPQWKRTDDLVIGDRVAVDRGMEVWPGTDPCAGFKQHIEAWMRPVQVERMTDDIAYFLGLWLAKGSCEQETGRVTITCGDDVGDSLRRLTGHGIHFKRGKRRDQWRANSYELVEFMRYIGMPLVHARHKTMPPWVLAGTRAWAGAFVGGMWDGDGYCDRKRPRCGYDSSSLLLAQHLQLLLTNAGIVARLGSHDVKPTKRVKVASTVHDLTVTGENIAALQAFARLRIQRKRRRLAVMDACDFSRRDGVPLQAGLLRAVRNSLFKKSVGRKSPRNSFVAALNDGSDITYRSLAMFVNTHAESGLTEEMDALRQNLRDHYFWDTIESLENSEARTYDFTIPDTHSFWCNGFIHHQTPSGYNHFKDLFDEVRSGTRGESWSAWRHTSVEGGNIDSSEVEAAKADLSARDFRQEYEATFESIEGRIYHSFMRDWYRVGDDLNHGNLDESVQDMGGPILVGMDFNVAPMCATLSSKVAAHRAHAKSPRNPDRILHEMHTWKEYRLENANTSVMMQAIRADFPSRHLVVFPDPSGDSRKTSANIGETDHSVIRDFQADIYVPKFRTNSDKYNTVNGLLCNTLGHRRALINPRTCPWLVRSLDGLTYVEGSNLPDKSQGYDHMTDAYSYSVMGAFPIVTDTVVISQVAI